MVACCLVFDLSGYGYLANASGRPMPTGSSTPSCNKASITGLRSDNCTGMQTAAAARGGQSVSLAANPAFTSTVIGLLNGDTMMTTYGDVATTSSTVGTSFIATAISDPVAANYAPIVTPGVLTVAASQAPTGIDFSGGFAASQGQMILNGSTDLDDSSLQLTDGGQYEAGSAWYDTPVNIQAFTTNFTFQLSYPEADGITFAIQNNNTSAIGGAGANLGYGSIPNSLAITFGLFSGRGGSSDSTGLYVDGAPPINPAIDMTSSGVNLHSGDIMAVQLVYDGATLTMTITDTVTNATFSTSFAINIPATVGGNTAYVGFTGSTSRLTANQQILTWTYTPVSAVAIPTFNVAAGPYTTAQSVTISDATSGATIYYTANGTTPTTSSTQYTGPITVSSTETLEAIAVVTGSTNSAVATAAYIIQGTPVPAAISFVQVASATPQSPTATVSVVYSAAQTLGDLNLVVVGWNDTTATVQSVSDSAGNNYSLAIGPTSGTGLQQSIYYAANIAGGSNTVTVTFSQAPYYPDVRILEYQGVTTLDVTAGASGNSATSSSGPATTRSANELIFGANTTAEITGAAGSGFTSRVITGFGDIAEDMVVTAAGSNSATAPLIYAGPWVMQMATFSAVSSPAPTVSSVSPNSGSTAGGAAVTITGTNFVTGAAVTFGGTAATNVVVVSGTQITATSPAGSAGAVTVTVTDSGGQSGSVAGAFTYIAVPALTISPTNLAFGSVEVNTASMETVTLSSTGTAVTVSAALVTGAGFTVSGGTFPITLNPGQAVTLDVQFEPTATGAATGQLTIQSNASTNGTAIISLSGTGTPPEVYLSWDAPSSSPNPVAGYNIYRSTGDSSAYQLLNASVVTGTTYLDNTVQSGLTYNYYVESVNSSGAESAPSNTASVTIP
jgi:Legume lectin domain/IPT/TIG domain/Chitobiase/beta-hexosaminidase C-terminal domain/Abnormal spindle-like microcephaly-assoc'd, ASPM-SPD-2-Hydin